MVDDKQIRVLYVARGRSHAGELQPYTELQSFLAGYATRNGFPSLEWTVVTNQKTALRAARSRPPRLVLVEVDAPGQRLRFCEMMRYRLPAVKLVAVGQCRPPASFPCDAFLHLPLDNGEVAAIVTPMLDGHQGYLLQRGPIHLNLDTRTVITPKGQYHMTPKQLALLQLLMLRHNQVVSRRDIMGAIWETNYLDDTRTLDVHIRWLRERIELDPSEPKYLVTVRGRGYRLNLEVGNER